MIEPLFLSISELAERWRDRGVTTRQIFEHGVHQRLAFYFLFDGLAIPQSDTWLTTHGASQERRRLQWIVEWIASAEAEVRKFYAGDVGEFSPGEQEIIALKKTISKNRAEGLDLEQKLEEWETGRARMNVYGYLVLLPRMIADIQASGDIKFPHRALSKTGQLVWLEEGASGRWADRLKADDLLILFEDVKAFESPREPPAEPAAQDETYLQKVERQQMALLAELKGLGYDPKSLPHYNSGGTAKKQVTAILLKRTDLFSASSFKHTWDALLASGEVAWAPRSR